MVPDVPPPAEPSFDEIYGDIYQELHEIARRKMRGEASSHTLQPTALVHEAYLRLSTWKPEGNFDATDIRRLAARVMGNVLRDYARGKRSRKRGGDRKRVTLSTSILSTEDATVDLLTLAEALTRLHAMDARAAEIVELLYFGDMKETEVAAALGISERTVRKDWRWARTVLSEHMAETAG